MSVTTAETETDCEDCQHYAHAHVLPKCFQVAAHIVGFRVVLGVDLVLGFVNGVLVAVIVHSICIPNSCIFHMVKTGLLRCCLYTRRRLQQTAVSCKRSICNKQNEFVKAIRLRVFSKVLLTTGCSVRSETFVCHIF